jgi:AcrR family transcriptional regulator
MPADTSLSLRERKKLRTRTDLAAAALRLFAERGYDHVTIEDIAAEVEVSPSTFLRYFDRKEDVLFVDAARLADELAQAMTGRPADEPVAVALRHALLAFADTLDQDRDLVLAKSRISVEVPSLRARSLESQVQWEDAIARAIAVRLGCNPGELRVRTAAACAIAAVRISTAQWITDGAAQHLRAYLADALDVLDHGLTAALAR